MEQLWHPDLRIERTADPQMLFAQILLSGDPCFGVARGLARQVKCRGVVSQQRGGHECPCVVPTDRCAQAQFLTLTQCFL